MLFTHLRSDFRTTPGTSTRLFPPPRNRHTNLILDKNIYTDIVSKAKGVNDYTEDYDGDEYAVCNS
ncbi:MAG: hypothetical protein WCT04_07395, partial [Planctomycetota bacterium]